MLLFFDQEILSSVFVKVFLHALSKRIFIILKEIFCFLLCLCVYVFNLIVVSYLQTNSNHGHHSNNSSSSNNSYQQHQQYDEQEQEYMQQYEHLRIVEMVCVFWILFNFPLSHTLSHTLSINMLYYLVFFMSMYLCPSISSHFNCSS